MYDEQTLVMFLYNNLFMLLPFQQAHKIFLPLFFFFFLETWKPKLGLFISTAAFLQSSIFLNSFLREWHTAMCVVVKQHLRVSQDAALHQGKKKIKNGGFCQNFVYFIAKGIYICICIFIYVISQQGSIYAFLYTNLHMVRHDSAILEQRGLRARLKSPVEVVCSAVAWTPDLMLNIPKPLTFKSSLNCSETTTWTVATNMEVHHCLEYLCMLKYYNCHNKDIMM